MRLNSTTDPIVQTNAILLLWLHLMKAEMWLITNYTISITKM